MIVIIIFCSLLHSNYFGIEYLLCILSTIPYFIGIMYAYLTCDMKIVILGNFILCLMILNAWIMKINTNDIN